MALLLERYWDTWRYSNAPEGEKPFEKVMGLSKYGLLAGLGVGAYDAILFSQTYTFWRSVNCIAYWVVPFTSMCATFASVTYTAAKLRGKDDYVNYFAASLATTGVFNHWQKSGRLAFTFGVFLTIFASMKKYGDLNDYKQVPLDLVETARTEHATLPFDWTLTKDPRGPKPWE